MSEDHKIHLENIDRYIYCDDEDDLWKVMVVKSLFEMPSLENTVKAILLTEEKLSEDQLNDFYKESLYLLLNRIKENVDEK
jgi:hypothetical protein